MRTLHTVNRADALLNLINVCSADDALLLLEDGVYAVTNNATTPVGQLLMSVPPQQRIAIRADIDARNIGMHINIPVNKIEMAEFVNLTLQYDRVVAWS